MNANFKSMIIEWPKGASPTVHPAQSGARREGESPQVRVSADGTHLRVGDYLLPVANCSIRIPLYSPVVVKCGETELKLEVPSWINGAFDFETTKLFGEFCQAALDGEADYARRIAASVWKIRRYNYLVVGCVFLAAVIIMDIIGSTIVSIESARAASWKWALAMGGLVACGAFISHRNKKRVLNALKPFSKRPKSWLFWR